jgi:hypothetical protein
MKKSESRCPYLLLGGRVVGVALLVHEKLISFRFESHTTDSSETYEELAHGIVGLDTAEHLSHLARSAFVAEPGLGVPDRDFLVHVELDDSRRDHLRIELLNQNILGYVKRNK